MNSQGDYKRVTFDKGDVLLREGENGEKVYLILKGSVDVCKGYFGDAPRSIASLGKGNVVGELALFDGSPHVATVVAAEPTEASAMSRKEFQQMVDDMDPVMKGIVGMMVLRLRQVVQELLPERGDVDWADWGK
ncbi:MAG: cyclic nucleotide-binding domain-containing protein [Rhodospirillales bacterium]|nr:cyclic nucleotide-binding domain-containing protein [Alphaproteobacteria bacterium]MBL6948257.1 cyclic nucleotide-binding domain-containing protein [Rhodospirillales bacterium]